MIISELNNHTAISSIFFTHLAVRWLSFVNGDCIIKSKIGGS